MKISRDTPDVLILDDTPWALSLSLAATVVLFAGAGLDAAWAGDFLESLGFWGCAALLLGMLAAFARRSQLVLDRRNDTLIHRVRDIRGFAETRYPLATLTGATVQTDRESDAESYRIILILHNHPPLPVTPTFSGGSDARTSAQAINTWLDRPLPAA